MNLKAKVRLSSLFIAFIGLYFILTLPQALSLNFDNVKTYDDETKTVTIKNNFGLGQELAKIRLLTPHINHVAPGRDKLVAEFEVIGFQRTNAKVFDDVELINLNNNNKLERKFQLKYAVKTGERDIPRFGCIQPNKISEICTPRGFTKDEKFEWIPFNNPSELPNGIVRIGLFTDVAIDDFVEFFPTIFGIKIEEWAVWSGRLNEQLITYYTLNESTGTYIDDVGDNDIITIQGGTRGRIGILNGSYNSSGADYLLASVLNGMGNTTYSYSFWLNPGKDGTVNEERFLDFANGSNMRATVVNGNIRFGVTDPDTNTIDAVTLNKWQHIVITYNGTTFSAYKNGTLKIQVVSGSPTNTGNPNVIMSDSGALGGNKGANGSIDEIGFWNRTLSADEVAQLYNNGTGITQSPISEIIEIALTTPADGESTINSSHVFRATSTIQDNAALSGFIFSNVTLYIWYSNGSIFNTSIKHYDCECAGTSHGFNMSFPVGSGFKWNAFAEGIKTNGSIVKNSSATNRSFSRTTYSGGTETYDNFAYETENKTFKINITLITDATLFSGSLTYRNKAYLGDIINWGNGLYELSKKIDIPKNSNSSLLLQNIFNWSFTFDLGSSGGFVTESTSNKVQNVSYTNITAAGTIITVNYTIYDEETLVPVSSYLAGQFVWFLGGGTELKNVSFNNSHAISHKFTPYPTNRTFYTDVNLEIKNSSYDSRLYDFNLEPFSNSTIERFLFIPNSSLTRDVRIIVKDIGYLPLGGYFVTIKRYYSADNSYKTVENRRTDDTYGSFIAKLIENDVKYLIEIRDENNTLKKTVNDMTFNCGSTTKCELSFIIGDETTQFDEYKGLENFNSTLSFNNNTNIFTFVWNDNRQENATFNLTVIQFIFNSSITICSNISTEVRGRLSCSVGNASASYLAQAYRKVGTNVLRVGSINTKIEELINKVGLEGLYFSFIFLFILISIGIYNPVVGVSLYLFGFFILGLINIAYVSPVVMFGMGALGVLFIWLFRS